MPHLEVGLLSNDPAATTTMLTEGLGARRVADDQFDLYGLRVTLSCSPDGRSGGLSYLQLNQSDPVPALAHVLAEEGYAPQRLADGSFATTVHGVVLRSGQREDLATDAASDTSGVVLGVDHIGIATDAAEQLSAALIAVGFTPESHQIDTQLWVPMEVFSSDRYGVLSHAGTPAPAGALSVTFLRLLGLDLELLQDIMSTSDISGNGPGSTTGDNRAIANYVARRGPGLHHLAVRVADMDAAITRLRSAGVPMIDAIGRPGSRRSQIAFADRKGTGGIVIHLVQRED